MFVQVRVSLVLTFRINNVFAYKQKYFKLKIMERAVLFTFLDGACMGSN